MNLDIMSLEKLESKIIAYESGEQIIAIDVSDYSGSIGIIVKNNFTSVDAPVTIKGGNSIFAGKDYSVTVPMESEVLLNLKNIGRYKNVTGENKGKIVLTLDSDIASDVYLCAFYL